MVTEANNKKERKGEGGENEEREKRRKRKRKTKRKQEKKKEREKYYLNLTIFFTKNLPTYSTMMSSGGKGERDLKGKGEEETFEKV